MAVGGAVDGYKLTHVPNWLQNQELSRLLHGKTCLWVVQVGEEFSSSVPCSRAGMELVLVTLLLPAVSTFFFIVPLAFDVSCASVERTVHCWFCCTKPLQTYTHKGGRENCATYTIATVAMWSLKELPWGRSCTYGTWLNYENTYQWNLAKNNSFPSRFSQDAADVALASDKRSCVSLPVFHFKNTLLNSNHLTSSRGMLQMSSEMKLGSKAGCYRRCTRVSSKKKVPW